MRKNVVSTLFEDKPLFPYVLLYLQNFGAYVFVFCEILRIISLSEILKIISYLSQITLS